MPDPSTIPENGRDAVLPGAKVNTGKVLTPSYPDQSDPRDKEPSLSRNRGEWLVTAIFVLLSCVLLLIYASGGHATDLIAHWLENT
jgi:hypothetical protein